jgi:uncharacterized pyridoxamine 5'-phosphate oxidase family protein
MNTYVKMLVEDIHSVIMATVDEEGHPFTRAIDLMIEDGETFYFLTAKGKEFYRQLINRPFIACTGLSGKEGTMNKKAISIKGEVTCIGHEKLDEIFEKNPYMAEIYPKKASREALVVFKMICGEGEFFDLSTKPITRASFTIGQEEAIKAPYTINENCVGCGKCAAICPQNCIDTKTVPFVIEASHCLHCGMCFEVCDHQAVSVRGGK